MGKLPSGNYRVQKMVDGVRYSLTFDHEPTKKDVTLALSEAISTSKTRKKASNSRSFYDCVNLYCDIKSERISPKYRAELLKLPDRLGREFSDKDVTSLTQIDMDLLIRSLQKKNLAPKTVSNYITQARAVIRKFNPSFSCDLATLEPIPIKQDSELYIPTQEEVKKILEYFDRKFPDQYCGIALSCYGLRRGEVLALTKADLDDEDVIHISRAVVRDEYGKYVVTDTKTVYSVRDIPIRKELADRIRSLKTDAIFPYSAGRLRKSLIDAQKNLGIQHFELHKLRHYFATQLHQAGVSDADIIRLGGWQKGSDVLNVIYRHSTIETDKERRKRVLDEFSSNIF